MITTMKITKARLKQIIKEELESITNEARAPRNAIAFARQVQQTIEDKVGNSGSLERSPDYKPIRHMDGQYMSKSQFKDDRSQIDLPIYHFSIVLSDEIKEAQRDALESVYGRAQEMTMGLQPVQAIPVGKFAIVFGGTKAGTIGIAKRL